MTYRTVHFVVLLIIVTLTSLTSSFITNGKTVSEYRYGAHYRSAVALSATGGFGSSSSSTTRKGGKKSKKNKNDPSGGSLPLSNEAKKLLKKYNSDVDLASAAYFRSQMEKIMLSPTDADSASTDIEGMDSTSSDSTSLSNSDLHRARVATTWDTIALFLPNDYARTKGRVEPEVDRRLKCIAKATMQCSSIPSKLCADSVLLDVGCGDGALVPYLYDDMTKDESNAQTKRLKIYYGLDVSQKMIDLAKQRWTGIVSPDQFLLGSFPDDACNKLKQLDTASCDAIIFNGSLQFFQDTIETLKDAENILRPGGRIIISHVNGAYFVKDECQKNPGVAVRTMPNKISLEMMADVMGMKVIRKDKMGLTDLDPNFDGDDEKFYLVVLEKPTVG